jgi:toxin HigB-1
VSSLTRLRPSRLKVIGPWTASPAYNLVNLVDRLRKMLAYPNAIEAEELKAPPNYGAHQLTSDTTGVWSLVVTKNWRMTFRVNSALAIEDMDLEDYR